MYTAVENDKKVNFTMYIRLLLDSAYFKVISGCNLLGFRLENSSRFTVEELKDLTLHRAYGVKLP